MRISDWSSVVCSSDLKLRQGVTFHDGSPLTAEDVKFTFDRLIQEGAMEGQTSPRKSLLGPLEEIRIVDERTVQMILSEPWPILPAMLPFRSEEHTSELQSLMRHSYAVFCLTKKKNTYKCI